ncbi:MAG: hypothetical protein LDL41_12875 [Coleofasciculus sp. S288]|nr:hypothetical protein [Coleofasciculus sp. S288]
MNAIASQPHTSCRNSKDTISKESLPQGRTVPKITIEVPEELSEQLAQIGDRLPELLRLSLQQPPLPAHIYRYILNFLASKPTPQQIAAFRPTSEMQERLRTLLARSRAGELTATEQKELDEYERIEHLVIMLKAGNLPYLTSTP